MKNQRSAFACSILLLSAITGCSKPAKVEVEPPEVVLEGSGTKQTLTAKVYNDKGEDITQDHNIVWFSTDTKHIKLSQTGEVESISSGEAEVEVEVVGTDLKTTVPIRVKIASSIKLSHERLRLWLGQEKTDVWAEVRSEKDAFIEGYLPTWSSDDPSIVKTEAIQDPKRRQSWVKLTGLKSGSTQISAQFRGISETIRVAVFSEDEEIAPDGTRIQKEAPDETGEEKK